MKHIAFVVKYFPTVSETFIVNQINGLIDAGCKVSLFAYQKIDVAVLQENIKRYGLIDNVRYFIKPPKSKSGRLVAFIKWTAKHFSEIKWHLYFKSLNFFKFGKEAYTLKLFFEAQWFLVPYDFELIHAHFGMNGNRIAYLKTFGIIPKHIKLINTFHGYDLMPNRLETYTTEYAYLFKEASAFTVNTRYLEGLFQQVNTYDKPCYILPVGLDTAFFKREASKISSDFFNLVFCGKLIHLKGADLAIESIRKLHDLGHKHIRLHVIGDGVMRDQLALQVEKQQLNATVFFYGSLSQRDIKAHFQQADAFILPGRYELKTGRAETQGLVIQEAQAMELPVIVSDVGGMKYGLLPNKTGFVVAENDIDGFVEAIKTLILNPELKREMGENARQFVKSYDTKILVAQLQEIYNSI